MPQTDQSSVSQKLDNIDKKIIKILQNNARISNLELAEMVNLSPTPCARRVKNLEELGIITGYHAHTNAQKLGFQLSVFIAISMEKHTADQFNNFEEKLKDFPEIVSCSIVTGRTEDYLIKAVVRDMAHYEEFLLHRLNRLDGIAQVHTSFELREVFSRSVTS